MCIVFLRYRDISGNLYTSLMNIYHMTRGTILVNKTYTSCAGITPSAPLSSARSYTRTCAQTPTSRLCVDAAGARESAMVNSC